MTIASERSMYPPDLFEMVATADRAADSVWWLVHVLPRQEKAVAHALRQSNVAYYLPTIKRRSLSKGRTRVAEIALFPGYIFAYGNADARSIALRTNRVLTVRRAPNNEVLTSQLLKFKELIDANAPLLPEARVVAGERVRVKAGPFRGVEGVAISRNGRHRLLVVIDYLQQGASLEIDDSILERVVSTATDRKDDAVPRSELSPPAIVIAWAPDQVSEDEYVRLVSAIGDLVRVEGGVGIRRLQSLGFGVPAESGVIF